VSYILDALKKAAEQRDAHVPAMRRLFSPVPEIADSPRWRLAAVAGGAAVAGAIVAVWVLWPTAPGVTTKATSVAVDPETPPPVVATRAEPARPVAARAEPAAPPVPVQAPVPPPPVRMAETPPAPVKPSVEKRAVPLPAPPVPSRPAPVESVAPRAQSTESVAPRSQPTESVAPRAQSTESVVPRPQPTESVAPRPQPAAPPATAAVRPAPAPAAASRDTGGPLRLEVIVYSEERARRLAFINGRKYVEGDVLQDGTRIQEIQPNAVVIIDDGRSVVLRP
jgi:hypothetical protein